MNTAIRWMIGAIGNSGQRQSETSRPLTVLLMESLVPDTSTLTNVKNNAIAQLPSCSPGQPTFSTDNATSIHLLRVTAFPADLNESLGTYLCDA